MLEQLFQSQHPKCLENTIGLFGERELLSHSPGESPKPQIYYVHAAHAAILYTHTREYAPLTLIGLVSE